MNIIIETALAKSTGIKLITHNKNVSILAEYIGKSILSSNNDDIIETIRIGGLIHDIGKILKDFQKILKNQKKITNNKFRHNEIGWAFIYKYLNITNISEISNSVYWHHGISNKLSYYSADDIISTITDVEINIMSDFIIKVLGADFILSEPRTDKKTPSFYYYDDDDYNERFVIIRSCIISADRIISEWEYDKENYNILINNDILENEFKPKLIELINKKNNHVINKSPYKPEHRFKEQHNIAYQCELTSMVKAPAGFGKSLVGIIWLFRDNKKTFWVCPRNVVAESVYDSIIKELKVLNLPDVSVELYLSGEVKMSNHSNPTEFSSDIIITNIDNFETPSISDKIADKQFLINTANVVFDEFHEFLSSAPYFANFINIMRARHRYTNSKTLLLSATPINIDFFWNTLGKKTIILPNTEKHYPAIHQKKYLLRVVDEFNYDLRGSDIIIFNSISEAQYHKSIISNSILYHSGFDVDAKKTKYNYLMTEFGKDAEKRMDKKTIISTLIAQASFDVSFHKLYESCQSPESSLQRPGRCDRFGDYNKQSIITVFKLRARKGKLKYSRGEDAVTEMFYTKELRDKWFDELKPYDGQEITLDEMYEIYNQHVIKYADERKKYFNSVHRFSKKLLSEVYPIKFPEKKKKDDVITAGSNKLRSMGSEIFFIINSHDDTGYVGPFSTHIYKTIDVDFNETGNIRDRILSTMDIIMKSKNPDFDYTEILKNKKYVTLDKIRIYGRKSNTPYIRYDKVYHPDYGLINKNDLYEFNKQKK